MNIETIEVAERGRALIEAISNRSDNIGHAVVAMTDGLNRVDAFRCWYAVTSGVVGAWRTIAAHSLTCDCGSHDVRVSFLMRNEDGSPLAVDDAPPARARVMRFLAASGNRDRETAWALFITITSPEEISEFCALVTHALKDLLPYQAPSADEAGGEPT